jgi:hypothetical protein
MLGTLRVVVQIVDLRFNSYMSVGGSEMSHTF